MSDECGELVNLLLSGGQVNINLVDLALELSILVIQLVESLTEFLNLFGLVGGGSVDGVNDCVSEFVQAVNNLLDNALVGEVLFSSQVDEGLDHGGVL